MIKHALVGIWRGDEEYYIELSEERYYQLKTARAYLFEMLSIEDKFNLVLENYAEFERELLNSSVSTMIFRKEDWSSHIDEIHLINRRLINLLTTCRLYIDQTAHNICSIYGKDSEQEKVVERQKNLEYDSTTQPGYRVMESIRNYVQHRELPVYGVRHNALSQGDTVKHTIEIDVNIKTLAEDKKFKRKIIEELEKRSRGNSINLVPLVREYIASIGKIHLKIRDLIKPDLLQWETILQEVISEYYNSTRFSEGLTLVVDDSGTIIESLEIFNDFMKRRQSLENKNEYISHYSSHFISSEIPN
jgi:hypothetical protein